MTGTLTGLRIVELESIGPAPHACMLLADMGADVVRVVRPDSPEWEYATGTYSVRNRTSVLANLKDERQRDAVVELIDRADVLVEGMRPGVAERLGLGPDERVLSNPRLVYARMTGWGQTGPLALAAGHDINYISLTGALHAIGPAARPIPPMNMVGDFGGGSMFLVTGILAALLERQRSGLGQVVDVSMTDGASSLLQPILELRAQGRWNDARANNMLDGGAPYYRTYECSDGRFMAVGAVEPQFWARVLDGLGLNVESLPEQNDAEHWPGLADILAEVFRTKTRDEWAAIFDNLDACVTPVLTFAEAADHPHIAARRTLVNVADGVTSAPAPRFSRSVIEWTTERTGSVTELEDALKRWTV
jgi:alpha-methylacyl-CoA racemase